MANLGTVKLGDTVHLIKPFEIKPGEWSLGELPAGSPVKLIKLGEREATVQLFTQRKLTFDIPREYLEDQGERA